MVFIIGGAYQGKLDCAKTAYCLSEDDVYTCEGAEIDFSCRCVQHIESFVLACVREGVDASAYFAAREELWRGSVLICDDIGGGVVPLGADMRAWREETGRLCRYLSGRAERVTRVFCGLEQRLK